MTQRRRLFRASIGSAVVALGAVGLLLAPALGTTVALPAKPSGTSGSSAWAYGAERTISVSGLTHNGTYSLTADFAFHVVLSELIIRPAGSAGGGILLLESRRTVGAAFAIDYCVPTCARPWMTATVADRAYGVFTGFANLTTNGTVFSGLAPLPALGLLNSSTRFTAFASENDSIRVHGLGGLRAGSGNQSLRVTSGVSVSFLPALGLVPQSPTPGQTWNASSQFTGSGSWEVSFSANRSPIGGGPMSRGGSFQNNSSRSGTVTAHGDDLGPVRLTNGNLSDQIALALSGPFRLRDGFLLVPTGADLFGEPTLGRAPVANGSVGEALAALDWGPSSLGHVGPVASSASFSTQSSNPGSVTAATALAPAASETSGPVLVQAQPESTAAATQGSLCIVVGSCVSAVPGGGAPGSPRMPTGVFVVSAIALVAVVGIAGTALLAHRRPKAPERSNALLYPPVSATRPPASARKPGSPPPPLEAEPDPLGHLW